MQKWFIEREVPGAHIGARAIIDAEGFTVCEPSPMGEANARLIAAAPAMLAALKHVRDEWCEGGFLDGTESEQIILAAIAAATGER